MLPEVVKRGDNGENTWLMRGTTAAGGSLAPKYLYLLTYLLTYYMANVRTSAS